MADTADTLARDRGPSPDTGPVSLDAAYWSSLNDADAACNVEATDGGELDPIWTAIIDRSSRNQRIRGLRMLTRALCDDYAADEASE